MTIAPISNNTAVSNTYNVKPQNQATAVTPKAPEKPATDNVTISKQAVLLNSKDYSPVEEAQESGADKAFEKTKGQR